MIRPGQLGIEREFARAAGAVVITDDDVGPASRNIFVDGLSNLRLERSQIARQIDHDVALLSIYGIEFDAKLSAVVIGLASTISGHRSHFDFSFNPHAAAA